VIPALVVKVDAADAREDGTGVTEPGDLDGQWSKWGERVTECVIGYVDDEQRYQRDQVAISRTKTWTGIGTGSAGAAGMASGGSLRPV
jgi:hypothetical protein